VLVALSAIVALSQVAAVAEPAHSTRAKRTYGSPGVSMPLAEVSCSGKDVGVASGNGGFGLQNPQVSFRTQSAFRTVSFQITDHSTTEIWAVAWQGSRVIGIFCGRTPKPLVIRGAKPVTVAMFDAITDRGLSVVTTGTVTAIFSS
jgi:hypothetical protein